MTAAADAVISGAEIVAGHDGAAELLLRLRHGNGVEHPVVLDASAAFDLMRRCDANDADALIGRSWRMILSEG